MMKKYIFTVVFFAILGYAKSQDVHIYDDLTIPTKDSSSRPKNTWQNILREIRFQAYVQVEWQKGDTTGQVPYGPTGYNGVGTYQGGTFSPTANNRFLIRRGRAKLSFEHKNKKDLKVFDFAFQFDATERSFTVKDFYGRIIDPWTGWFSLQGGIFLRPFGFESPANPAFFESPEFARVNQTIMPNEVELGEALVIESPAKFDKVYFRLDANVVNGQGVGNGPGSGTFQTGTYQSRKDFIGRIKAGKMWELNGSKFGVNGGFSYYNGGVLQTTSNVFILQKDSASGLLGYTNIGTAAGVGVKTYKREYYDGYLELKSDYPIGITALRAEYIGGLQPGAATSSSVPLGLNNDAPVNDLYLRRFNGGAINLTQSFKTKLKSHLMMHDITVKFDWYNPQTQIKGRNLVDTGSLVRLGLSTTDMTYYTFGFGYSIIPVNWFKLMIWYDYIINENTNLLYWTSDYKKDNMLTIRTQFYIDSWWFNSEKSKYKDNLMAKKY